MDNVLRRKTVLIALSLILLTTAVFAVAATYDFVNYDDPDYVTENRNVKAGLTLKGVGWAFTTNLHDHWHPLTWMSHMLDCQLFGLHPAGPHTINILLHVANTLLIFLVLLRMTKAPWKSALVAAFFALHPLHVETVAWVTGRKDLLSTFFMFLTLWVYARYAEQPCLGKYLLALSMFAMGLLAKSMLVTLPVILILLDYWPLGRFPRNKSNGGLKSSFFFLLKARVLKEKIPFFLLSIIDSGIILFMSQNRLGGKTGPSFSLWERLLHATNGYAAYVKKLFWPTDISIAYQPNAHLTAWITVLSAVLILGISLFSLKNLKRRPYLMVGWLWFLVMLFPVIGFIRTGPHILADRYSYVTYIGLFIMVSWAIGEWSQKGLRHKQIAISAAVLGIVLCSFLTLAQVKYWKNSVTLFTHAIAVNRSNVTAQLNLGLALHNQGNDKEAMDHLKKAIELAPEKAIVQYGLASFLSDLGKTQEAIPYLSEAIRLKPGYLKAHVQLGICLARIGKFDQAYAHFKEAINLDKEDPWVHYNYGNALGLQKKYTEAIGEIKKAVEMDPHYELARNRLSTYKRMFSLEKGIKLFENGKVEEAAEMLEKMVRLFPDEPQAYFYLGLIASGKGQLDVASSYLGKAVKANPEYAEAYVNLGIILNRKKAYEEAEKAFMKAIEVRPEFVKAHYNYAVFLYLQHRNAEAMDQLAKSLKINPNDKKARDTLHYIEQSIGKKEP